MRSGDEVPSVLAEDGFDRLMREISAKNMGASAVVDGDNHVVGIFTDGDLRRRIQDGADLRSATAGALMHAQPRTISSDALAVDAAQLMARPGITSVLVVNAAQQLVGMVHIRDLMVAKVI